MPPDNDKTVRQPPRMPASLRRYFRIDFAEYVISTIGVMGFTVAVVFASNAVEVVFALGFLAVAGILSAVVSVVFGQASFVKQPATDEEIAWMADVLAHELDGYRYYDSRRVSDRTFVLDVAREYRRRTDNGAPHAFVR